MLQASNTTLENYFEKFRQNIIGTNASFVSPYGLKRILYCDWIASGRLYKPIEDAIANKFGPFVANTHTETSATGVYMTKSYAKAREIIKEHVNANQDDVLISFGSGMTAVVNKLQRIMGLKLPEQFQDVLHIPENDKPIVFVSHMEHHSNHTSWLETICDVEIIEPNAQGNLDLNNLHDLIVKYKNRKTKIAAISACSNVTGIITPYYQVAEIMHQHDGLVFVDFACSAPYVNIDMHPANELQALDAIYFSPHKFLGGPGSNGILVFNKKLYNNNVPDSPGGGTVKWTNAWHERSYIADIEAREDGGTPAFLQTIRVALAIKVKNEMGVHNITKRDEEILQTVLPKLTAHPNIKVMGSGDHERVGVVSFYIEQMHYNLTVRLLNDLYGIQVRGGCFCAGTYGHYLIGISIEDSHAITDEIERGMLCSKPGWVRLSLHPTLTSEEVQFVTQSILHLADHWKDYAKDYDYDDATNEFIYKEAVLEPDYDKAFEIEYALD
jgi:selenocysteine lyase/cysteine desulfurase